MFGELERTEQEVTVVSFKVLSQHSPGDSKEQHGNISARTFGVPNGIGTWHLQKHSHLNQLVRKENYIT